jgi:predicted DCC family thiol-disulfide oxidoreductase YuxK
MKIATLLYDSECTLCVRFKKALEYLDNDSQLNFKSIYDPSVYVSYPDLDEERCKEIIHLIDHEGRVFRGADVITFLLKIFPGVSKFSWLLDSESGKKASNAFYKKINDIRNMKKRNCYTCGSKFGKK